MRANADGGLDPARTVFHVVLESIEPATPPDIPTIAAFIEALAIEEQFPDPVAVTESDLRRELFGEHGRSEAIVGRANGEVVAFALYYFTFSTTRGRPGLHLDDLYVHPSHRGRGLGRRMMHKLASTAIDRGCVRFEWWALGWNERARSFYREIGAQEMNELVLYRLQDRELNVLASHAKD